MEPPVKSVTYAKGFISILDVLMFVLLPMLWIIDDRYLVSLLFKTIESNEPELVKITELFHIAVIVVGLQAYFLFRYDRLWEHNKRYEYTALKCENYVDEVKLKLLKKVNDLIDKREKEWGISQEVCKKETPGMVVEPTVESHQEKTSGRKTKRLRYHADGRFGKTTRRRVAFHLKHVNQ